MALICCGQMLVLTLCDLSFIDSALVLKNYLPAPLVSPPPATLSSP